MLNINLPLFVMFLYRMNPEAMRLWIYLLYDATIAVVLRQQAGNATGRIFYPSAENREVFFQLLLMKHESVICKLK